MNKYEALQNSYGAVVLPIMKHNLKSYALENTKNISCRAVAGLFPGGLLEKLAEVHAELPGDLYMTGGTVRDLLLGRQPADIDLTVVHRAKQWAGRLADCVILR